MYIWIKPEDWQTDGNFNRDTRYGDKITCENPNWVVMGEVVASLAAASIVFRKADYQYHVKLLKHAEELYRFANDCAVNSLMDDEAISPSAEEPAWAAAWLYRATNQTKYLLEAKNINETYDVSSEPYVCETGSRAGGVQTLLAQITKEKQYLDKVENFCNYYIRNHTKTPKGLLHLRDYQTLPRAANLAFLCLQVIL